MNRMPRDQILDHQVNDEKSKKVEKKGLQSEKDNQGEKKKKKGNKEKINWNTEKKNIREFLSKEHQLTNENINEIINSKDEKLIDLEKFNDFKNKKVIDKNLKTVNSKIKLSRTSVTSPNKKATSTSIKGKQNYFYNKGQIKNDIFQYRFVSIIFKKQIK